MPNIGEIQYGRNIGYKNGWKYQWTACIDCGKERWVALQAKYRGTITNGLLSKRCKACGAKEAGKKMQGVNSVNWQGGRMIVPSGYVFLWLDKSDFFFPMTHKSYVKEHRLTMARHLGRCLQEWEVVHHKNGIRDDNRIENLELTLAGNHIRGHSKGYRDGFLKGLIDAHNKRIKDLESRVTILEAENALLRGGCYNESISRN